MDEEDLAKLALRGGCGSFSSFFDLDFGFEFVAFAAAEDFEVPVEEEAIDYLLTPGVVGFAYIIEKTLNCILCENSYIIYSNNIKL